MSILIVFTLSKKIANLTIIFKYVQSINIIIMFVRPLLNKLLVLLLLSLLVVVLLL
jgi:hypothetical protein